VVEPRGHDLELAAVDITKRNVPAHIVVLLEPHDLSAEALAEKVLVPFNRQDPVLATCFTR
jgi:hypothetical protein